MGKLRYHGSHVYYHFTDQHGKEQKLSLKLKVDRIRKDPRGKETFPLDAHALVKKIDRNVFDRVWGLNTIPVHPRITLQAAFDKFIKPYRNTSTIHIYTLAFSKLIDYFGDIEIESITEDAMLDFRKTLFEKYKEVTVEIFIRHIKIFLHYVEDEGYISKSPVTKRVRMKVVDSPIVIFSDRDLETFFTMMKDANPEARDQLYFLLLTGWRVSDSCELTWNKIDIDRGVIKHYIGKKNKTWEYPMDKEIIDFLAHLPRNYSPHVFYYRDYHSVGKEFRKIADTQECGINITQNHEDLNVHTLRKQFTFNCFRNGVPLEICSKLLGHSSIKTTEKYYTYWDTQMLRDSLAQSRRPAGKKPEDFPRLETAEPFKTAKPFV